MTYQVTIFQSIKDTSTPFHRNVGVILERIKSGATKELVKKIRAEKRKPERNELKKQLPAICFSGTFTKRADNAIIEHSGLICLDFDGYQKQKELLQDKENLSKNKYVYSVFVSPSGNGLKVLVKIPADQDNHINYFNSLEKYFNSPYFDKTSKNISRVCYESYDPLLHINENSSVWDVIEEIEYTEVSKYRDQPTIPITDENKVIEILIKWWTKKYPMIEGQRNHNVYILAMAFNDFGINKSLASYVLNQYATTDFTEKEIATTIDSAYRNTSSFGTKYYEDEEEIYTRIIDPRLGAAKYQAQDGSSSIIEDLAENDIICIPAPGLDIEDGLQALISKMSWDTSKPMDSLNRPKFYVSEECGNIISALSEYTGEGGLKEAHKDAIDVLRYACIYGLDHVEAHHLQITRQGSGGY